MKVTVTDPEALGALRPLDIVAYLRARGWTQVDPGSDDPLPLWETKVNDEIFEVYCPLHQNWRDYVRRVREVLSILGQVEERSELAIIRDISEVTMDVVRLVAHNGQRSDGTIPFADGLYLGSAGRGMMLSAACAAIEPKRAYHSRKPAKAIEYLDGLRLGQSERGSYVLTVLSPVIPALVPRQTGFGIPGIAPPLPEDPFERRVTRTLAQSIATLKSAAGKGAASGQFEAFETAVNEGVSADLCEAISLVRECASVSEFEVIVGWAPARPVSSPVPTRISFARDALDVIKEAGRILREHITADDFKVDGMVVRLARPTEQMVGDALVFSQVDGQPRKISIELRNDDWRIAETALKDRRRLKCIGDLHKEGNMFVLKNPRSVELATDD